MLQHHASERGLHATSYKRIESLTFGTASVEDRRRTRASWDVRDILASAALLACILAA